MKVVCISGKAQHGKDTAAQYMKEMLEAKPKADGMENSVLITHYGDLVKYVCKTFFDWNGKKDDAGRELLQTIGTDIVRGEDPDYWATFIGDMLSFFEQAWDYVLIADCRFPNEIEHLVKRGFDVTHMRIVRDGFISDMPEWQQEHISETALDEYIPDIYVHNSGYLAEFYESLLIAIDELRL